jgi:hypothetical protein
MLSQIQRIFILLTSLFALSTASAVYADTQITVTGVPQAKEITVVPRGYLSCTMVPAGYQYGVWKEHRKVCRYPGGVWTSGYWTCSKFKHQRCAYWSWEPSRWELKRHGHHHQPPSYGPPGPPPPPRYY